MKIKVPTPKNQGKKIITTCLIRISQLGIVDETAQGSARKVSLDHEDRRSSSPVYGMVGNVELRAILSSHAWSTVGKTRSSR